MYRGQRHLYFYSKARIMCNWGKCFGNQGSNWLDSLCQAIRGLDSETLSVSNSLYSFAHEPAVNIRLCRYQKFCLKKKNIKPVRFLFPFIHFAKFYEESSKINMSRTLRLMKCIKLFSVFFRSHFGTGNGRI